MQFINPMLLWGLLLLIFPIIFHLFYFRRYKELKFTNVKFLSELKEEKSVRDRLRQLLILLMRLAALAFLVLAFARPYLPGENQEDKGLKSVSIYIDNSFSMQAAGEDIGHLNKAKRIAQRIVNTYQIQDMFQIIDNNFDYNDQRWLSRDEALDAIEKIELSPVSRNIEEIAERQGQIDYKASQKSKSFYLISDFQKSFTRDGLVIDTTIELNLVYLASARQANLSIDSVWMDAPIIEYNQINPVCVKISNYGTTDIRDAGLSLKYDGQTKPLGVLGVKAGESNIDTFNIVPREAGWQSAEIMVKDYPVNFDNTYYIAFNVPKKMRILSLYGKAPSRKLQTILEGLKSIEAHSSSVSHVEYGKLASYDLVILHSAERLTGGISQALNTYVQQGGKLLFFPSMDVKGSEYQQFLLSLGGLQYGTRVKQESEVYKVNKHSYVFQSVFEPSSERIALPQVHEYYRMDGHGNYALPLLSLRNGQAFITQVQSGKGYFYQCATGISEKMSSLLLRTDVFIPMMYRMALQRKNKSQLSYTIGDNALVTVEHPIGAPVDEPIRIKGPIEFIPAQQPRGQAYVLNMHNQVKESGVYNIVFRDSIMKKIGFNYNRVESDLAQVDPAQLKELFPGGNFVDGSNIGNVENYIRSASLGTELWKWCIVLVLIFLALEQIFVRFLRKD